MEPNKIANLFTYMSLVVAKNPVFIMIIDLSVLISIEIDLGWGFTMLLFFRKWRSFRYDVMMTEGIIIYMGADKTWFKIQDV